MEENDMYDNIVQARNIAFTQLLQLGYTGLRDDMDISTVEKSIGCMVISVHVTSANIPKTVFEIDVEKILRGDGTDRVLAMDGDYLAYNDAEDNSYNAHILYNKIQRMIYEVTVARINEGVFINKLTELLERDYDDVKKFKDTYTICGINAREFEIYIDLYYCNGTKILVNVSEKGRHDDMFGRTYVTHIITHADKMDTSQAVYEVDTFVSDAITFFETIVGAAA